MIRPTLNGVGDGHSIASLVAGRTAESVPYSGGLHSEVLVPVF